VKHHGRSRHRLKDNPLERKFADLWEHWNRKPMPILAYLVGDGDDPGHPTEEQAEIAATVVQWLGSPVGEAFLKDAGFVQENRR
jgi:hypothetical protein